jgi:hypothetical protein
LLRYLKKIFYNSVAELRFFSIFYGHIIICTSNQHNDRG